MTPSPQPPLTQERVRELLADAGDLNLELHESLTLKVLCDFYLQASDSVRKDAERLAEAIAKRIFEMGAEYGQPCHRIEFKVNIGGVEHPAGGLAREPFTRYVRETLASAIQPELERG